MTDHADPVPSPTTWEPKPRLPRLYYRGWWIERYAFSPEELERIKVEIDRLLSERQDDYDD